jgi:hypothetical protein
VKVRAKEKEEEGGEEMERQDYKERGHLSNGEVAPSRPLKTKADFTSMGRGNPSTSIYIPRTQRTAWMRWPLYSP